MARKTGFPKEVGKDDWEETEQEVIKDISSVKSMEIGLFLKTASVIPLTQEIC